MTVPESAEQYEAVLIEFADHPRLSNLPRSNFERWYREWREPKLKRPRGRPAVLDDRALRILHLVIKELCYQLFPCDWGWVRECVCDVEIL